MERSSSTQQPNISLVTTGTSLLSQASYTARATESRVLCGSIYTMFYACQNFKKGQSHGQGWTQFPVSVRQRGEVQTMLREEGSRIETDRASGRPFSVRTRQLWWPGARVHAIHPRIQGDWARLMGGASLPREARHRSRGSGRGDFHGREAPGRCKTSSNRRRRESAGLRLVVAARGV